MDVTQEQIEQWAEEMRRAWATNDEGIIASAKNAIPPGKCRDLVQVLVLQRSWESRSDTR